MLWTWRPTTDHYSSKNSARLLLSFEYIFTTNPVPGGCVILARHKKNNNKKKKKGNLDLITLNGLGDQGSQNDLIKVLVVDNLYE